MLLEKTISSSIENGLREDFARRYQIGRRLAAERLAKDEPDIADRLPVERPYSLEQTMYDWLPARP